MPATGIIFHGVESSAQVTGVDHYSGFKSVLSYSKISGHIQYQLLNTIASEKFDPNDLGFLKAPNEVSALAAISYNQFSPTKHFLSYKYSLSAVPVYLFTPYKFSSLSLSGSGFWYFKNFWDLTLRVSGQPVWMTDFFEMRTPGKLLRKTPYWYTGASGSSDSRKRFYIRFNAGYAEAPKPYKADSYNIFEIAPRYRFSEHFTLDLDLIRENDKGQYGYVLTEASGEPVAGRRHVVNFTSVLNGVYNFTPRMNLSFRARHYWSQVRYTNFYYTDAEGNWLPHSFINNQDRNFNAFNMDMFYTWDFKYGSKLIIGYKNWLGNDFPISGTNYKNYTTNFAQVFQQPHGNEVTVRLIYYIDYLTLQKKKVSVDKL
jgi:hypothetical protein